MLEQVMEKRELERDDINQTIETLKDQINYKSDSFGQLVNNVRN